MIRLGATLWLGPIEKLAGPLYVELINEELLVPNKKYKYVNFLACSKCYRTCIY